ALLTGLPKASLTATLTSRVPRGPAPMAMAGGLTVASDAPAGSVLRDTAVVPSSGEPSEVTTVMWYVPACVPAGTVKVARPPLSVMATGSLRAPPGISVAPLSIRRAPGTGVSPRARSTETYARSEEHTSELQ